MRIRNVIIMTAAVTLAASAQTQPQNQPQQPRAQGLSGGNANQSAVEQVIAAWPPRPKLGAQMMLSKYGAPQAVTQDKLVWENKGAYKRITVTKQEHHHDFPLPHTDFMEHTVSYKVPADKTEELSKYDGSCTFDRTKGELSARCDLEGHNILTLNLAHDIATGKKGASEARKAFGEIVVQDTLGKHPAYVEKLQFQPVSMAEFSDQPVIPGSPVRPDSKNQKQEVKGSAAEGEVLGTIIAIDMNEVVAAMVASKKQVNSQVAQYAKMLHEQHGMNVERTMKLGQKIDVTPLATKSVDDLRAKAAGELAKIVPLEGEQFSTAFIAAMVKSHAEALQMIDSQLVPQAKNQELKQHLTQTRQSVAKHLQMAQQLQGGTAVGSPAASEQAQQRQPAPQQRTPQQ